MFFHFFIYHVHESLATDLSCCLDDLLYFSLDPSEAFEIINGFTPQNLPACIDCFWFQFTHWFFNESYCISNAEGFLTWTFGSASMAARITSKTWRVNEALTHLMISWSSDWSSEVVFSGKNTTWTFSSSMLMDLRWPGALSIIKETFTDNPPFSKIFLDFCDALVEPFSEQHWHDRCLEVMLHKTCTFFCLF